MSAGTGPSPERKSARLKAGGEMTAPQDPRFEPGSAGLLIFDGDCGFCTWSANWVACRWSDDGPEAVPFQTLGSEGLQHLGLSADQVAVSAWWVDAEDDLFDAERAIGKALQACRAPWGWLGTAVLRAPGRWLARLLYPLVARHRHRLPGGTPACRVDHDR